MGLEPAVLSKALTLSANQVSEPIKGETAVYVLKVLDSKESANTSEQVQQKEQKDIMQVLSVSLIQSLMDMSEIEDNRSVFY